MDASVIAAIASASGVIVTAISGYFVAKRSANKDVVVNDRIALSQDEKDFRAIILDENKMLRQRLEELERELTELKVENRRLQVRIIEIESNSRNTQPHHSTTNRDGHCDERI